MCSVYSEGIFVFYGAKFTVDKDFSLVGMSIPVFLCVYVCTRLEREIRTRNVKYFLGQKGYDESCLLRNSAFLHPGRSNSTELRF